MVDLDQDTVNIRQLGNNIYEITINVSGMALNPISVEPLVIFLQIIKPNTNSLFSSVELPTNFSTGDTVTFTSEVTFIIHRSEVGRVKFEFFTRSSSGLISNALQKTLLITRNNSRPEISNIVAPDTIIRPTSGFRLIKFSVMASDSDGYGDIEQVFFQRISPTVSSAILMFDSGDEQLHGDQVAGDGVFSRVVQIDSTALFGNQIFLFQAADRLGTISDSLTHTITIIP
ncbi:MAG: hypothetical protein HY707_11530 [Ignavibacteriae bacterium]|nr:hypothetical protein [Ignavibacteriota bacterium]